MYFAPPAAYDDEADTAGRHHPGAQNQADFAEPVTAGLFVSIAAWAGEQREEDETPYWRTLKAGGELNPQYPGGAEAQKAKLEAEGRTVLQRGRTHIRYVVADYQDVLFTLE